LGKRGWNGKWAALSRWSRSDGLTGTARARAAAFRRFELQVDPDFVLSPEERYRRAKQAERAFLGNISRRGSDARWKR
jgi:hypothetical protein